MRKILFTYYILMVLFFGATAILTAENTIVDSGSLYIIANEDTDTIDERDTFEDDYFWAGAELNFSGIADDLYLFGRKIIFDGKSSGAATAFGDTVEINGIVAKNLHSAASDVRITGVVEETAFIGAENITISEDAVVNGTLLSGSNTLHIIGTLNNGLLAGAGEIIIDGPVKGDVNVRTGKLIITERGSISGNLIYGSNVEISDKEASRVMGSVKYEVSENIEKEGFSTFFTIVKILFYAALGVSGLLLLLLPAVKDLFSKERELVSYGKTTLWGLIPLFIYPVAVLVTIPLFPLSVALGLSVFPLLGLTTVLGLAFSGQLLFKVFKWEKNNVYLQFLLAFGIFVILAFIPYVKVLVGLGIAAMGAGLLISKIFKTNF